MKHSFTSIAAALLVFASVTVSTARATVIPSAPQSERVQFDFAELQQATMLQAQLTGLEWKVGDKASYALDIAGFIKGTSDNSVREDTGTAFWIVQDMNLMIQKQKIEILLNKTTGKVEKILVDGKEQQLPKVGEQEILEMKEAHITVKAGEFDCVYAKIKDKESGKITEAWLNPKEIPMTGMLKAIAESQLGKVTQELTSFQFAPR